MNELVKASPAPVPEMHRGIVSRDPETNLEAALSRLASLSCKADLKRRMIFPTDPKTGEYQGWREVVDRAVIAFGPNPDLPAAQAVMAGLMAPAPDADIGLWLTELSTVTARRSEDAQEAALTIVAYTKRLKSYPGDIVRATLSDWSGKWFPTWGELKEIMDARAAPRLAVSSALVNQSPGGPPEIATDTSTPEGRKKRIDWLKWSIERIENGRPFPQHRHRPRQEWHELISELKEEIQQLEALEG